MATDKYGRTYHLPFSKGVTNDDRVCWDWEGIATRNHADGKVRWRKYLPQSGGRLCALAWADYA